jgi:hypothetical protein
MADTTPPDGFQQASIKTADDLQAVAASPELRQLSHLTLPEIAALSGEIARIVPAGNVPGIILSGLARVDGRDIPQAETKRHIGVLFRGARQMLDKAVYGAFFAGPAAVLYGYQQLLRLAGRSSEHAFPEGTWQFYLGFALREDSARHANETITFDRALAQYHLQLDSAAQLASWLMAAAYFVQQLPAILANEWYERVATKTLADVGVETGQPNAANLRDLFTQWEGQRPYRRGVEAGADDYPTYRRRVFDEFLQRALVTLPSVALNAYHSRMAEAQAVRLPAYLNQMSWLAYLDPDSNQETRVPYPPQEANIGFIWRGRYHLIPLANALDPTTVHSAVLAAMTAQPRPPAALDDLLVAVRRAEHPTLRASLSPQALNELEALRRTPVLINWDERDPNQALVSLRQTKRGIGDHPLTLIRTSDSMVFDQSHIFFDGVWGASVAEIMTNEAVSWALYFSQTPAPTAAGLPYSPNLSADDGLRQRAQQAAIPVETGAENTGVKLAPILSLRKLLKQRNDMAQVTVNDILLLYRGLHARQYRPSSRLQQALDLLQRDSRPDAQRAHRMISEAFARMDGKNPAMLIPIDASRHDPAERVFPTTFRNPLVDFYDQHQRCVQALNAYRADQAKGQRGSAFQTFHDAQAHYLRLIAGFGELLTRYRTVALMGQSTSIASIRFLGGLPPVMQKLLDTIPSRFDVLNEVIKGEEVFSNMGRVAKGSGLRRFITAKDDNEQKTLAWGVLTDDQDTIHLSLRDFRPHVTVLQSLNLLHVAQFIAQDYLDAYADGLNQYVEELRQIVLASRETQLGKME